MMTVLLRVLFGSMLLVALALAQTGCCSIVSGTTQQVAINSTPSGATVSVNGMPSAQTPVTLPLRRGSSNAISIEKEGYEPYDVALSRGMNGWVFGNILFGGLIGLVVDVADGAIYTISPDSVFANLSLKQGATTPLAVQPAAPRSQVFTITAKLKQLKDLKEGGYITEQEYNQKKMQLLENF